MITFDFAAHTELLVIDPDTRKHITQWHTTHDTMTHNQHLDDTHVPEIESLFSKCVKKPKW